LWCKRRDKIVSEANAAANRYNNFYFSSVACDCGNIVGYVPGREVDVFSPSALSAMKMYDSVINEIKQGGVRRGAGMCVYPVSGMEIFEFVRSKIGKEEPFSNVNISVAIDDVFCRAVGEDAMCYLLPPGDSPVSGTGHLGTAVPAVRIWEEIVFCSHACGDPGLLFLDRINATNPTPDLGRIYASNPCGEIPALPFESCNLGSINLSKFFKQKFSGCLSGWQSHIDLEELKRVTRLAVRFLDDVIEVNSYPVAEIEEVTKRTRKIGLGVMGWADLLYQLETPYASDLSFKVIHLIMETIKKAAIAESCRLAEERGVFPAWEGSIYDPSSTHFCGNELKLRNATLTTIAPTGTISMIAGCSSGIEPNFLLAHSKNVMGGRELVYENKYFREKMYELGLYSNALLRKVIENGGVLNGLDIPKHIKDIFVTAHEITPEEHLRVQEAFQEHVCNSISKTINLPNGATREEVDSLLEFATQTRIKGITVFRDKCKSSQVYTSRRVLERCNNPDEADCPGVLHWNGKCWICDTCGYSDRCSI